jgi:hypothetical protein
LFVASRRRSSIIIILLCVFGDGGFHDGRA